MRCEETLALPVVWICKGAGPGCFESLSMRSYLITCSTLFICGFCADFSSCVSCHKFHLILTFLCSCTVSDYLQRVDWWCSRFFISRGVILTFHPLTDQKNLIGGAPALLTDVNEPPKSFLSPSNNFMLLVSGFSRTLLLTVGVPGRF